MLSICMPYTVHAYQGTQTYINGPSPQTRLTVRQVGVVYWSHRSLLLHSILHVAISVLKASIICLGEHHTILCTWPRLGSSMFVALKGGERGCVTSVGQLSTAAWPRLSHQRCLFCVGGPKVGLYYQRATLHSWYVLRWHACANVTCMC